MTLPGVTSLLRLEAADSTQTVARRLAEQGAAHGTLVWAERQTRGRGRLERRWESKKGGLYVSLILRPETPPSRLAEISLLTAKAAADAITRLTGINTKIKQPNDVMAVGPSGRSRKICGILAEASGDSRKTDWLVLGVGINVNNAPSLKTASSLKALTGKPWDLEHVLRSFLGELEKALRPAVIP